MPSGDQRAMHIAAVPARPYPPEPCPVRAAMRAGRACGRSTPGSAPRAVTVRLATMVAIAPLASAGPRLPPWASQRRSSASASRSPTSVQTPHSSTPACRSATSIASQGPFATCSPTAPRVRRLRVPCTGSLRRRSRWASSTARTRTLSTRTVASRCNPSRAS